MLLIVNTQADKSMITLLRMTLWGKASSAKSEYRKRKQIWKIGNIWTAMNSSDFNYICTSSKEHLFPMNFIWEAHYKMFKFSPVYSCNTRHNEAFSQKLLHYFLMLLHYRTVRAWFQSDVPIILLWVKAVNIQHHGKFVPKQEKKTFVFVLLVPHHKNAQLGQKSWKISSRSKLALYNNNF